MPDIDSDADPDTSPHTPAPQTPTGNAGAEHYHHWSPHQQHHPSDYAVTPDKPSPTDSSSLNLPSLGMSTFSAMPHQLSIPFTTSPPPPLHYLGAEGDAHEENMQNAKDVLVQRLNDLAAELSQQDLKEDSVNGLHAKVDEMERALATRSNSSRRRMQIPRSTSLILQSSPSSRGPLEAPLPLEASLPLDQVIPSIPNMALPTLQSSSTQTEDNSLGPGATRAGDDKSSRMSPVQANRVVEIAQNLYEELESVTASLRARQEESDHIHDMLIMRAERAAQRIIHLENRIKELERERNENEMEMFNLQIQLKAIEVQCLSYVPEDADQDLRQGISAWKTEWSTLKWKRARRRALADGGEDPKTPPTPTVRQPRNADGNEHLEIPTRLHQAE
ncbi:hypothetical protein GGR52DRAFT_29260 [Hypoxylon sp. FL1284]|nr:hypothetical protein GGR52DRAFT_29260 [Hypoxylon sp. FL1284]